MSESEKVDDQKVAELSKKLAEVEELVKAQTEVLRKLTAELDLLRKQFPKAVKPVSYSSLF